jgi:hypothetical protein
VRPQRFQCGRDQYPDESDLMLLGALNVSLSKPDDGDDAHADRLMRASHGHQLADARTQ